MNSNLDLSGLDSFSALMKEGNKAVTAAGKPLMIAVDLIDEDPANKRQKYDPEKMRELADSIAAHGVVQPISVKSTDGGRYQINHGHRRFRASKLAGLKEIPAFVAEEHNSVTQLVENIQRENLTTAETVAAIAELLTTMKQSEIVAKLGKSKTWVSRYAALADLPEELRLAMEQERCRDASTLYEALQCYKIDPEATTEMLVAYEAAGRQIVQTDIEDLRAAIKRKQAPPEPAAVDDNPTGTPLAQVFAPEQAEEAGAEADQVTPLAQIFTDEKAKGATPDASSSPDDQGPAGNDEGNRRQNVKPTTKGEPDPTKVRKPLVQVRVGRREGVLIVGKAAAYGLVWVEYEDGTTDEVDAGKVKLVAITEGAK